MRFRRSGEGVDIASAEEGFRARKYALEAEQARLRKEAEHREHLRREFFDSPAGQSRRAFEREDRLFQFVIDVTGASGSQGAASTGDPAAVLNAVSEEGWELVTASFVSGGLAPDGRDKTHRPGADARASVFGYYLFRRSEGDKKAVRDPWDVPVIDRVCPHCEARMNPVATICPECLQHSEPWRLDAGRWWRAADGAWEWLDVGTGDWHAKTEDVPAS